VRERTDIGSLTGVVSENCGEREESTRTISELIDQLDRIREELLVLQRSGYC
jgi:hypothetical protein